MATEESLSALQGACKKHIQENHTGVTEGAKRYFKVQLRNGESSSKIWIPIKAGSEGAAFVTADTRTLDTKFHVCEGSITEITQQQYYDLISRTL